MATRTLTFAKWLKLIATRDSLANGFGNVTGYPAVDAAEKLNVTRQRVYQLIDDDTLDTIAVTTSTGRVTMTLVTAASIDRYLADRVPDRNRQGYFSFQKET